MNKFVKCAVYPAAPDKLAGLRKHGCRAAHTPQTVTLENDYLAVELYAGAGVVKAVTNKLTGARYALHDDQTGFGLEPENGHYIYWLARGDRPHRFQITAQSDSNRAEAGFTAEHDGLRITLQYALRPDDFWIERRIVVEGDLLRFDRLVYGKLAIPPTDELPVQTRILELGLYDRPRLILAGRDGGLFGGIGWWFYAVDENQVYQNTGMHYQVRGRFESAPWYLGVFAVEPGETYPGWLWYKTFLQARKLAYDRQPCWSYWNAGWGQWGIDLDDPAAEPYIDLIHRLGVRQICFGGGMHGKGAAEYVRLAREDRTAQRNIAQLQRRGIAFGFLAYGALREKWNDPALLEENQRLLRDAAGAGFGACHFDFFYLCDTFTAHAHGARYMRAARERLAYTECHLGMAHYGPQFQREVIVNHPSDIGGFDITNFSPDWTSFRAFRHERCAWQQKYQYLMPEYGLYYFLTHYANPHPRLYRDPEPHELFCAGDGQGFNFHDRIGFREVMVAAAAFTPFYIFGHLDLKMPEADVAFARQCLVWVAENVAVIREARVCYEDNEACVVSKIRNGQGAVFLVNYGVEECSFALDLACAGAARAQVVYPSRQKPFRVRPRRRIAVTVRGGSVVILDINGGLKSLPPENPSVFPIAITDWRARGATRRSCVVLPRAQKTAAQPATPPRRLLSIDRFYDDPRWAEHFLLALGADGAECKLPMAVKWFQPSPFSRLKNIKKIPRRFREVFEFEDNLYVATWKFAPWAFADRLWLVWKPAIPPALAQDAPTIRVNRQPVKLTPRVNYRNNITAAWTCPIYFADITGACRFGAKNTIAVPNTKQSDPGLWYIVGAECTARRPARRRDGGK